MAANRYFVVLSGSVIFETENRTFTLNKNEDLFVPASTRAFIKNAGGPVQSKILCVCQGWGFERFIAATAANKPAVPLIPELEDIASRYGIEAQIIEAPKAPELGKWISPRPASHEVVL
jgi:mannose-6-phosphate isomerase-like protein (cupin superfamily)